MSTASVEIRQTTSFAFRLTDPKKMAAATAHMKDLLWLLGSAVSVVVDALAALRQANVIRLPITRCGDIAPL